MRYTRADLDARHCSRCSMPTRSPRSQLCSLCYDERSKHTYWDKGEACRAKGPTKAECLLEVDHYGDHEGNGYDDVGPLPRVWGEKRRRAV